MTTSTFDQLLTGVRQLPPRERARLVARVVEELAEPAVPAPDDNDAWERLERLREEFAQMDPVSPTPAEQLDADRRERDAQLMGRRDTDVHT